jgi:hypothetical protein
MSPSDQSRRFRHVRVTSAPIATNARTFRMGSFVANPKEASKMISLRRHAGL